MREALGATLRETLSFGADVRLRSHGPDQRGQRRPLPCGPSQRIAAYLHSAMARAAAALRRRVRVVATRLFLAPKYVGIHESSEKALRIMQITTVMVVILIAWCLFTIGSTAISPSLCRSRKTHISVRCAGLAEGHRGWTRYHGGCGWSARAFAARDERLRNHRAGLPRNRSAQAEEPSSARACVIFIYACCLPRRFRFSP